MQNKQIIAGLNWYGCKLPADMFLKYEHEIESESVDSLWRQIEEEDLSLKLKNIKNETFKRVEKDLSWLNKNKCNVVVFGDALYPKEFLLLDKAPSILTYMGSPCWVSNYNLGVVGSREPNRENVTWMDESLTELIESKKFCIVSGGARGVDQKAHQVAIRSGVATLCFLPSGLASIYPKSLNSWVQYITDSGGALISQFSPFEPMQKGHFHARNALIASLCDFLLVVEARRKSGTLMTAKLALDVGRPIGVVPCSPMTTTGQGGLDLIYEGAFMVRNAQDLSFYMEQCIY